MPGRSVAPPPPPGREPDTSSGPVQGPSPRVPVVGPLVEGESQWMDEALRLIGGVPAKAPAPFFFPLPGGLIPGFPAGWAPPLPWPFPPEEPSGEVEKLDERVSVAPPRPVRERKKDTPKPSKRKDGGRGGALSSRKPRRRIGGPSAWERFWRELVAGNNPFTGLPWGIDPATGEAWKPPEGEEDTEKLDERRVYAETGDRGKEEEDERRREREAKEAARSGTNAPDAAAPAPKPPCPPPYDVAAVRSRWEAVDARLESLRMRLLAPV